MKEDDIKRLKKRFDTVWQNRKNDLDDHCSEVALHVLPSAIKAIKDQDKHDRDAWRKIVDNTGKNSLKVLAAGMVSGTCSPSRPWFVIAPTDQILKKDIQVKQWLKDVQDAVYAEFSKSNIYRVIHHCYIQEGAFGTTAALIPRPNEGAGLINLIPMTFGEFAITVDTFNRPNGVYRKFKLTVSNMVEHFGIEHVSETVKTAYEADNLDQEFVIHHAIYARQGAQGYGAKNMPYASIYFEANATDKLLRESGMQGFEVLVGRWTISSSDIYGESPASECLGDMRAIQKGHQQIAKGVDYQVSPPMLLPAYLKGQERETLPNGIAYYNPAPGDQSHQVQPMLNVQFDMSGVLGLVQQAQDRVKAAFYTDLFLMLDAYDQGKMTATEVYERKAEKMLMLGPVVERQIDELLRPLVEICIHRVLENSQYLQETAPEAVKEAEIKIEFVSILALAQKASGASNLERMLNMVSTVAQVDPQILDRFDSDKYIEEYADIIGAPATVFRPNKDVEQIRSNRAKQQQLAQQQALMQQQAETQSKQAQTVKTVSDVDSENITDVMNQGGDIWA